MVFFLLRLNILNFSHKVRLKYAHAVLKRIKLPCAVEPCIVVPVIVLISCKYIIWIGSRFMVGIMYSHIVDNCSEFSAHLL